MDKELTCGSCDFVLDSSWFFCPHCGKSIKENLSISVGKQALIYFVSFFLTPFGLTWGIKYLRSSDPKRKLVGLISITLTIVSIVLMIIAFKEVMDQYSKLLDNYGVLK